MNEISVLSVNIDGNQILPLRQKLGPHIFKCYGVLPLHKEKKNVEGVYLTKLPDFASAVCSKLSGLGLLPKYWAFWSRVKVLDFIAASKIAKDSSKILYTSSFYNRSIKKAKKAGKTVVIVAGNSEASREHERIISEYKRFGIKHQYIYGDKRFMRSRLKGFSMADHIITISETSRKTYSDAGYDMSKFVLIPLTGTDFQRQEIDSTKGKPRVFITTAVHNFIKGTHRLLLAWGKAKIKDVQLIVAGRLCDDMQEFVDKYGPFENVTFTGYISGSLADFYKKYDAVGILLSLSEGAVRTTPELMSFGFPMIVSPDATCDIVQDTQNGFIINPFNEEELILKLKWFSEDWNRVYSMRNNVLSSVGHRTIKEFSEECADYLLTVVKHLS